MRQIAYLLGRDFKADKVLNVVLSACSKVLSKVILFLSDEGENL